MAEQLDLTTPQVQPEKTTTAYAIVFIGLYRRPPLVVVHLEGTNGERVEVRTESETEARTLLTTLNTANLSTRSLEKRALEWCATKRAALAGAVSGTPE